MIQQNLKNILQFPEYFIEWEKKLNIPHSNTLLEQHQL